MVETPQKPIDQRQLQPIVLLLTLVVLALSIRSASARDLDAPTVYLPMIGNEGQRSGASEGWAMVAGNPQRTSWTTEEVAQRNLSVQWYRPIEAYISQNSQIVAANGLVYVSTSRGLYAMDSASGEVVWRFDTEFPLGNSPTIADNVAYVGGYDRKLHALNANTGQHLWSFDGAAAGYDTNPLVVGGVVYAGNRDGAMYAIGAHGTARQGDLIWRYNTGGGIHISAAYQDGTIYFASNDNRAYALNANTGALVWRSALLPGVQFQSFWPVIYQDKVIFSGSIGYRDGVSPGEASITGTEREDIWPELQEGTTLGPEVGAQPWSNGYPVIDANRVTEYFEDNPTPDEHKHKPWRRTLIVLNRSNGAEFTFDSDGDGHREYIPVTWWGAHSGNRYPPIVGSDGILYTNNAYRCCSDAKGMVMGWNLATPSLFSVTGGFGALAEPQALSGGGDALYRNMCCDRLGDWFSIMNQGFSGELWSYDLYRIAPGYNEMWTELPGYPGLHAWYSGKTDSINAAYNNHGDQNPIVPYEGRLYLHRGNAVIAFGTGGGPGQLPAISIGDPAHAGESLAASELRSRLEAEVQKMLDAGRLRPGYYNVGQFGLYQELADYFDNPGETMYTLARAYPHLSQQLQSVVRSYLQEEFQTYFNPNMYASVGWADGAPREDVLLPPEVTAVMESSGPQPRSGPRFSWQYPPHNFYALWKYVSIVPSDAGTAYQLAKGRLEVPVPAAPVADYFEQRPFELNAWIAGYIGFLELQDAAAMSTTDGQLRTQVTNELNRLLQLRSDTFNKDSYWGPDNFRYKKNLDVASNFIYLVPELADHLAAEIPGEVQEAINEYEYIAPYWFVSRYEGALGEGATANPYIYHALFQAKAYILDEPQSELTKYLDVPIFLRGDLFYIQNVIAALEAQP